MFLLPYFTSESPSESECQTGSGGKFLRRDCYSECNQARKTVWGFKTSATIYLEYMQVITIWDLPELSIQLNALARVSLCLTPVCCTSCLPLSATPSRPVSWLLIPRWTSKVWKASEPEAVSSPLLFRNSRSKWPPFSFRFKYHLRADHSRIPITTLKLSPELQTHESVYSRPPTGWLFIENLKRPKRNS